VCRISLNRAIKLQIVDSNPCNAVDMPKVRKREIRPLEIKKCGGLFAACKDHRLGDSIILSAMTGLRKGEILALEWTAVNLREGVLSVCGTLEEVRGTFRVKETKSEAGRRMVTLGAIAVDALERRVHGSVRSAAGVPQHDWHGASVIKLRSERLAPDSSGCRAL
jgi:integrase